MPLVYSNVVFYFNVVNTLSCIIRLLDLCSGAQWVNFMCQRESAATQWVNLNVSSSCAHVVHFLGLQMSSALVSVQVQTSWQDML